MVLEKRSVAGHIGRAWFAAFMLGLVLTGPPEASAIFQYTDDAGTVHFTDDPGQIPEPIRKRMGIWVEPSATLPDTRPHLGSAGRPLSPDPGKPQTAAPSFWDQVVPTNIRSPWVPGLMGLAAAGSLLVGLRASKRPVSRVACKAAIVLVTAISAAATVMAALAERGSSPSSAIDEAQAAIDLWESRVKSPFQDAERRAKELGKAKREYQEMIKQFESQP